VIAAARTGGARFSVTARMNPQITKAITEIGADAWKPIKYPKAVFDEQAGGWVSDAAVAEVTFTAFTSRPKAEQVTARLIVRRVKRLNPAATAGQDELFDTFRYHAVFTDSAETTRDAEAHHRDHAIVEQVIVDLKNGPLAHLGGVHRQRRLDRAGHHRVQPHPRRRRPGRTHPRQGHDRDDPPPPDPRRRPSGHHRQASAPAPARDLALGERVHRPVRGDLRTTTTGLDLTHHAGDGPRNDPAVEMPGTPATFVCRPTENTLNTEPQSPRESHRRIRAQSAWSSGWTRTSGR